VTTRAKTSIWIAVVVIGIIAVASYLRSPERRADLWAWRGGRRQAAMERERFIASFDSLCDARLYPVLYRLGTFTKSRFEGDRERWILTVSSGDWPMRDEASKRDLAAAVWNTFCGVRKQAGEDIEEASLIIQDEEGQVLARGTHGGGVEILK